MIIPQIAFRNLLRQRRRSVLTGLTMVVGFVLLSLSVGLMRYPSYIDLFTRSHVGHIQIHAVGYVENPSLSRNFSFSPALEQAVRSVPAVESAAPRVFAQALALAGQKTIAVRLIGVDPRREERTTRLSRKIKTGRLFHGGNCREVLVGSGVAETLQLGPGSEMALITQGADGSIANDLFRVTGILSSERDLTDRYNCYLTLNTSQDFLALGDAVHEVAVIVRDFATAETKAVAIQRALGPESHPALEVVPWQRSQRSLYRAMLIVQRFHWVFRLIVVLLVALGVSNTVLMAILERTREFGVLAALGTRPERLFAMVLAEMVCLAVLAIAVGGPLSYGLNAYLSVYGIPFPKPTSMGSFVKYRLMTSMDSHFLLIPTVSILASAIGVSLGPAVRAALIRPAEALRTH